MVEKQFDFVSKEQFEKLQQENEKLKKTLKNKKKKKEFSKLIDAINLISAVAVTVVLIALTIYSGLLSMSDIDLNPIGQVAMAIWGEYAVTHSFYTKKAEKENTNKYPQGTDMTNTQEESQK